MSQFPILPMLRFPFLLNIVILLVLSDLGSSLFEERLSLSTELLKSDKWFLSLSDDENVGKTSSEGVTREILDVHNLIGTWVVLNMHKDTDTTNIVSSSDEDLGTILEFHNSVNLSSSQVILNIIEIVLNIIQF